MENELRESETDRPKTTRGTVLSWEMEKSWISSKLMGENISTNTILVLKSLKPSSFFEIGY